MENKKEYHYKHSDFKGSAFLIEDCKNHFVYIQKNRENSDLDIIINGVEKNLSTIDILKSLPNVTCDNLHSIYSGIKDIQRHVVPDERPIFIKHMMSILITFGFDFNNYKLRSKASKNMLLADDYSLLLDILEKFVKWCNMNNNDIASILFNM